MKLQEFISEIESCYGEYNTAMRRHVAVWLAHNCGVDPAALMTETLATYSTRWGRPPGIVEFRESLQAIRQRDALGAVRRERLESMHPMDRAQIETKQEGV